MIVRNARHHNLKNIDATFPIGVVTVVTGVSGIGQESSLVEDILWTGPPSKKLHRAQTHPRSPRFDIEGFKHVDKVISVDQDPDRRAHRPRPPSTYSGALMT